MGSPAEKTPIRRTEEAPLALLRAVLAVTLTLLGIAWAFDLYRFVGLLLFPEQVLSAILAMALPLVFLSFPASRGKGHARILPYDMAAALLGFATAAFIAVRFPVLSELIADEPLDGVIASFVMVILLIEALRRTVGLVLTGVVVVLLIYALIGHWISGPLAGRKVEVIQLFYYLAWDPTAIIGIPLEVAATIVLAFVFFGHILFKTGGTAFFTDISTVLMGGFQGGPAKIAVTASAVFGSISGSAVSNVVSTGIITIPLMRRAGYRPELAGAIEAIASTGGQLMPPIMGAAAFLMAEFLQISYTDVIVAALIPSVLYYSSLFILTDLEAARANIERVDTSKMSAFWPTLRSGWFFPLPFIVLILSLFVWNRSPEFSALLSAGTLLVPGFTLGYEGNRLRMRDVVEALRLTGVGVLEIVMICAAAGIVIGVLNITGLGFGLSLALIQLSGGNTLLLLVISAGICILLGMGMPTTGVYVLLASLVAPALVESGINAVAAHLFILYFGMMSMITPPVAIAAFAAASLTGADPARTGIEAVRFGWMAYAIPFLFVASPGLLMKGSPLTIGLSFVTALAGIWLISAAVIGYVRRPLSFLMRSCFVVAGILLLFPPDVLALARSLNLAGLALAAVLVSREVSRGRGLRRIWRARMLRSR
jgi:TRAP transporter 4TM/12TM fusion protein